MGSNTKRIILDNFTGGIGNDTYIGLPGGCYDGEGLDIRRGKRVLLSTHNNSNIFQVPNSSIITTMGEYWTSNNGYIYNSTGDTLYKFSSTNDNVASIRNYTNLNISGTEYTLLFGEKYISRFENLLTYDDQSFTYTPGERTETSGVYTHVSGNTGTLVGNNVTASKRYRVNFTVSGLTAGTFTITVGGDTATTISANGEYTLFFNTSTTAGITITPSSTFNGSIALDSTYCLALCGVEESRVEMSLSDDSHPLINYKGTVIFGDGNYLSQIDAAGSLIELFNFPSDTTITGITLIGDQIIIWTDDGQGGKQFYRDGEANDPQRVVYWYNERIINVVNQGNYHIVLTGTNDGIKRIWKSDGYSRQMLYQVRTGNRGNPSSKSQYPPIPLYYNNTGIWSNAIESSGDMVFLPGLKSVICYGKRIPGFSNALFLDYPLYDAKSDITAMYSYAGVLYVAYIDSSDTCKVDSFTLDNVYDVVGDIDNYFGKTGYISFNPMVFLSSQNKSGLRVRLGHKTPANTFMNIYYRLDREKDYFTFVVDETVNPVTTDPTVGAVYNRTGNIFTVTNVYKEQNFMFIETQQTTFSNSVEKFDTLNKTSGTGDSVITYIGFHNYRYFDKVNDTTSRKYVKMFKYDFNEVQFRVELLTRDGNYSPELNEFIFYFDESQNDR